MASRTPTEELVEAIRVSDLDRAKQAIANGANVNDKPFGDATVLWLAAGGGRADIVELLLSHGAKVRDEDLLAVCAWETWDFKIDSLEHANQYVRAVALLLAHGANPMVRNEKGQTPLEVAYDDEWTEMCQLLQKAMIPMRPPVMERTPVAILAGGLATRLRPITEKIPKVLVPVAGKPFLAHQLELLREQGVQRAVLCLGHLGEMVEREFGDGSAHGARLEYSFDGPKLLGTGGALKQALPKLGEQFFVLYGDSYLPVSFAPIADAFERSGRLGLMTVYRNEGKYDTSNVVFGDGEIKVYDKKQRLPEMQHIDYGLSLFRREVFESYPDNEPFDLADVMRDLVARKQLAGYEVKERFYEIGSHAGLEELNRLLQTPS
jgi:dTDP-glucose pyrophosphorylase